MNRHFLLLVLLGLLLPAAAWTLQAQLTRDGVGRVTEAVIETGAYRLQLAVDKGARLLSFVDKAEGVELARHQDGLGGLFEDRPLFSNALYEGSLMRQTAEELVLRCAVSHEGVRLVKTFTFREGQPHFAVRYEIENATQRPFRLWIRNFVTPGGGPITDADRVFLRESGQICELRFPDGYFRALDAPWAAYLDIEKRCGFFVRCDFDLLDCFYCWSASRETPTFEWLYKPVPPGSKTSTSLLFGLVHGLARIGYVSPEGRVEEEAPAVAEPRAEPSFAPLPNWKPLEELYQPTAAERARGFIAVVSAVSPPAPRLTSLAIDIGQQEAEATPVEIFALADEISVRARLQGLPLRLQIEDNGWLYDGDTLTIERGRSRRFWLKCMPARRPPGLLKGQLQLASAQGSPLLLPIQLRIWPAQLPPKPLIGTQLYAFAPTLSSYTLDEAARRKFLVYMDNLQALHCDNFDWAVGPHQPAEHLKVAGTNQLLKEWSRAHPALTPEQLPELDFSYYDLWFEEPPKRGMTRFVAHVPAENGWREAALIQAALGRKLEDLNSPEAWAVMRWYYRQLKAYAQRKGFTSFWAKIDDEIPPEAIPHWLAAAAHYRAAGYKTFTTNTGSIPRSEALLKEMNKASDAWQVALCLFRDFFELTRKGAAFETRREKIVAQWLLYTNGGAVDTWAAKLLGGPARPSERIDMVQIYVAGQPLKMKGGSGWGNKEHGVAFQYGDWIYLSLPDGGDPNKRQDLEISYRLRTTKEGSPPAVPLEPTDEIWYYGGGSYKSPYEATRAYAWRCVLWHLRGYGFWTYLWGNNEDILVRYRPETNDLLLSAAWEGLRDGNEDGAYFRLAEQKLSQAKRFAELARLRQNVFGAQEKAMLRVGEVKREIYAWDDFLQPTYAAYNAAKRAALEILSR